MQMSVRERILTIRLMEKAKANPAHADRLGIIIKSDPGKESEKYGTNQKPWPIF